MEPLRSPNLESSRKVTSRPASGQRYLMLCFSRPSMSGGSLSRGVASALQTPDSAMASCGHEIGFYQPCRVRVRVPCTRLQSAAPCCVIKYPVLAYSVQARSPPRRKMGRLRRTGKKSVRSRRTACGILNCTQPPVVGFANFHGEDVSGDST